MARTRPHHHQPTSKTPADLCLEKLGSCFVVPRRVEPDVIYSVTDIQLGIALIRFVPKALRPPYLRGPIPMKVGLERAAVARAHSAVSFRDAEVDRLHAGP